MATPSSSHIFAPIRWFLLLFIFSIPFENVSSLIGIETFTFSKLTGILLAGLAILQPSVCFARPPKAFWLFLTYLVVNVLRGLCEGEWNSDLLWEPITLIQCLLFFWISYNLLSYGNMWKSVYVTWVLSNVAVILLTYMGVVSAEIDTQSGRETVMSQNANNAGLIYAMGAISAIALLLNKNKDMSTIWRILFLFLGLGLAMKCAATGSRSAMGCIGIAVIMIVAGRKGLNARIKGFAIVCVLAAALAAILLRTEVARERWATTISGGHISGRDTIFTNCLEMFLEKPIAGWGPTQHLNELANREAQFKGLARDTHSDYFWVLTATGLLGGIPFLYAMWCCLWASWKGRNGPAGVFPFAFMCGLAAICLVGTYHKQKSFWIVASMACASGAVAADTRKMPKMLQPVTTA
ncbi:MAG: O-antigen ligase family protein [Planctomycetaceae bacterium]|nr:O-antigen ligase family protein [Planctomycetaceae bacterium]